LHFVNYLAYLGCSFHLLHILLAILSFVKPGDFDLWPLDLKVASQVPIPWWCWTCVPTEFQLSNASFILIRVRTVQMDT